MKKCAALVAALLLGTQLSASVSWAETIEEKRAQLDEIQQKLGEKDAQLEDKKKEISNAMERLILTQEELAEAKRKLAAIESRQQALSIKIRQNEAALAAKQEEYDKSRSVYKKRLRDIYENGQVNYLDVLLGAADFRDFSSRMYLLQRVIRRDFALIDRLEEQREALLQQKAELDDIRKQLAAAHAESQKEKEIVAQKTVERQKLYEQALAEKAQLDAEYEELQRNSQEITAMIQRMEQEGRMMPQAGGTGQLAWPVNGEITSPFGWRVHPIWGTQIFHAGLDIGADYGDPVHAADSGTVRNICPPKVTMIHWPTSTMASTKSNVRLAKRWWKAEWPLLRALALNRFHHCNMTNVVKKSVISCTSMPASAMLPLAPSMAPRSQ